MTTAIISLHKWCQAVGISDTTAWRWTKAGWLHPVRIANKLYLTQEDIDRFTARAKAGELAKDCSGACAPARFAYVEVVEDTTSGCYPCTNIKL